MVKKPAAEYAGIPLPEVEVFSNRLLSAETTGKVLDALSRIDNVRQITTTGESLSRNVYSGPAKGTPVNHSERKVVKVDGKDVELRYQVGAFYVELNVENEEQLNAAVEAISKACKKHLEHGFSVNIGRFSKYRPSMHDDR